MRVATWCAPRGGGGGTMQGPGQGSTEQYMPPPTGQPGASRSLGRSGCVPPRSLLVSRVQLSPEPRGVTPGQWLCLSEEAWLFCRMFPIAILLCSLQHVKTQGRCGRGCMCAKPEKQSDSVKSRSDRAENRPPCPQPSALPLRADEF